MRELSPLKTNFICSTYLCNLIFLRKKTLSSKLFFPTSDIHHLGWTKPQPKVLRWLLRCGYSPQRYLPHWRYSPEGFEVVSSAPKLHKRMIKGWIIKLPRYPFQCITVVSVFFESIESTWTRNSSELIWFHGLGFWLLIAKNGDQILTWNKSSTWGFIDKSLAWLAIPDFIFWYSSYCIQVFLYMYIYVYVHTYRHATL